MENNVVCEFLVANFPLMNLNNLVIVTSILSNVHVTKLPENNKDDFLIGFTHMKVFIDSYYDCLSITYTELSMDIKKTLKVP